MTDGIESFDRPRKSLWSRCGDGVSKRLWPMEREILCAAARSATGLADFGDPAIELRLSVLAKSIESEADLHPLGRLLAWIHLCDLLKTRLCLEAAWKRQTGLASESIRRPVFITGMPRSGSTFLHELLAQDGDNRAPLVWEVMSPLPRGARRQIGRTAKCLWWFRQIAPKADAVHPLRATTPHECVAIHSYTLLSRAFTAIFRVPAYEAFLDAVDLTPAYAWQKRFLQYLQRGRREKRWILKAPDHAFHLEALLRVFPDAAIIHTHRNPLEVLESCSRLIEVLQRVFARPQERREIVIREARGLADGLNRITQFRDEHPEFANRFLDVNYHELVSDPRGTVRRLYRELDLPLSYVTLERVGSLAVNRSRYGPRWARPRLADFGIDPPTAIREFANYGARFGIRQGERA